MTINPAQIHLALNHVPVVLAGASLLFLAWGVLRKSETTLRAGLVLVVLAAVSGVPTFLSGDPAGDLIEKLGAPKDAIHEHEEAAEAAFIALLVAGALGAGCLLLLKRAHAKARLLAIACLVVAAVACGLLARAAHLGGLVRHGEELRR
ncbi:MAG: hypothetical protein HY075_01195 [Deltaproteobacteria bacterium]|nr:hypothetical protein [Deltaproteobacteria bacterium]